ncbi:MAG: RNA pseudouridine synthase [Sedimentisphaerales bacterium]|nr:RNA pseudouridine synthase [Sedimentisphaerales bacterium]
MSKNKIEIIYEDERIIAVNKPVGINVTNDRFGKDNLIDNVRRQRKDLDELKIIHRLEKQVSGIIILAKNSDVQRRLLSDFKKGLIRKIYLAIITGSPGEKSGIIDVPLAQNKKDFEKIEVNHKHGKEAKTQWQLLADFGGLALLAVMPWTDRMGQIQVHLKHNNMPLVIDNPDGKNHAIMLSSFKADYKLGKYEEEKPLIDRLTLCAYEVKIENFADSGPLHLVSPIEKKFKATVKMLTKYNSNGPGAFINEANFSRLMEAKPLILDI